MGVHHPSLLSWLYREIEVCCLNSFCELKCRDKGCSSMSQRCSQKGQKHNSWIKIGEYFFAILVGWCKLQEEPRSARPGRGLQLGAETGRKEQEKGEGKQGWGVWDFLLLFMLRHYGFNLRNCSVGVKLYIHVRLIGLFTAVGRRKSSQPQGPTVFSGSCHTVPCNPCNLLFSCRFSSETLVFGTQVRINLII